MAKDIACSVGKEEEMDSIENGNSDAMGLTV